ncbi:MAG: hypothetical protein B7Y39_04555 [Bdellovibrio sp. 28-41-41]|nr:MAG: hypothetical protein B7Y39_04555 [Bdellovibrio sp. 28-41-41]
MNEPRCSIDHKNTQNKIYGQNQWNPLRVRLTSIKKPEQIKESLPTPCPVIAHKYGYFRLFIVMFKKEDSAKSLNPFVFIFRYLGEKRAIQSKKFGGGAEP